jgi:hypothetical protein
VNCRRKTKLGLRDALRLKQAELWLEVGQPRRALREFERITPGAWRHPWTASVFEAASDACCDPAPRSAENGPRGANRSSAQFSAAE